MPLLHEGGSKGRGLLHPDKLEGVTEGDGFGVADVVFPGGFLMAHFRNGARSHVFDFRTYFVDYRHLLLSETAYVRFTRCF